MYVVVPESVVVKSSNVPVIEVGITVWATGQIYALGVEVQKGEDIFESLKANNTDTPAPETTTLSWAFKRKTNYKRMFDNSMTSYTSNSNTIYYELTTNDIDIVAFFGLEATSVEVELIGYNNTIIYPKKTVELYTRPVSDWANWTTSRAEFRKTAFFRDIPFVYNATLKITITNLNGTAKCAHCVFGMSRDLGVTLADPKPISSIRNIIDKSRQADGSIKTENSMTYKRVVANVLLDTSRVSEVQNFLELYTVTPALFVADEREGGIDCLLIFGIYKDFDMPIGLDNTEYQLEIEGVI